MKYVLPLLLVLGSPALAQDWFMHKFGELRAYHGDWLAVCNEGGTGDCRITQTHKDRGSDAFFDSQLTLHYFPQAGWLVEVMDRGMPEQQLSDLILAVDGEHWEIQDKARTAGALGVDNVAETVVIDDTRVSNGLVKAMRAGRRVDVAYAPRGLGDAKASFSLRGITAAMNAVERHVRLR